MTNEELAQRKLFGDLYEKNKRLIYQICKRYENEYIQLDDLAQEAYFAVLKAVEAYNNNPSYKYTTYLSNAINWHLIRYIKSKGTATDLLSLDAPIGDEDGDCLIDTVADETIDVEATAITAVYSKEILKAVNEAMIKADICTADKKLFYDVHYFNIPRKQLIEKYNLSALEIQKVLRKTITKLNKANSKRLLGLRNEIIDRRAYRGTLSCFNYTQSSNIELTILEMERKKLL